MVLWGDPATLRQRFLQQQQHKSEFLNGHLLCLRYAVLSFPCEGGFMGTPCASSYIAAAPTSYEVRIRRAHIDAFADVDMADDCWWNAFASRPRLHSLSLFSQSYLVKNSTLTVSICSNLFKLVPIHNGAVSECVVVCIEVWQAWAWRQGFNPGLPLACPKVQRLQSALLVATLAGQAQVWWVKNTGFDGPKKGGARIFESRRRESRHGRKTLKDSSQTRSTNQDVTSLVYNLYPLIVVLLPKKMTPNWPSLNSGRRRGEELFRSWPRNNEMTHDWYVYNCNMFNNGVKLSAFTCNSNYFVCSTLCKGHDTDNFEFCVHNLIHAPGALKKKIVRGRGKYGHHGRTCGPTPQNQSWPFLSLFDTFRPYMPCILIP